MKILKFGGTSVGSAERIKTVIGIIEDYYNKNQDISVVFSAFGGVTDQLIEICGRAVNREDSYLGVFQNLRLRHLEVFDDLVQHQHKKEVQLKINGLFERLGDVLKGLYLLKELTPRIQDIILSYGERLSALIISEALKSNKIDCEYLETTKIIKTDSSFGNAVVNTDLT
ncbi:MAG: hypothetical protein R3250_08035, partial [Melioribacteraceae bacterium]|nr:hypothetical protein [Melioribacteraceae bacterium]